MSGASPLKRSEVSTLSSIFKARVDTSPKDEALRFFDSNAQQWKSTNWIDAYQQVIKVRDALLAENISVGDRVLIAIPNSPTWIYIEQAALNMGLVIVALPTSDSVSTIAHVADDIKAKIIFTDSDNKSHSLLSSNYIQQNDVPVVCYRKENENISATYFDSWRNQKSSSEDSIPTSVLENDLATIIYTSGSCEKPRGVKHSHKNIINNAFACLERIDVNSSDKMLSVTPISHCMERIAGYYVAMIAGASIIFPKSGDTILEDLTQSQATILVTAPHYLTRAYRRLFNNLSYGTKLIDQYLDYLHGTGKWRLKFLFWPIIRNKVEKKAKKLLLHQLKFVISGGSALPPKIVSLSNLLHLPLLEGYGLTEAGGVVSTNSISLNRPFSVGKPLCNAEVRLTFENELLVKSDSLMLGYWNDPKPDEPIEWLETQDIVRLEDDYIFIDGRKNQTIHLSTGEAILPLPIERQLTQDSLFENVMLYGENQEKLSLFCQLNSEEWKVFLEKYAKRKELKSKEFTDRLHSILLVRINALLQSIPGRPHINFVFPTLEPWSVENGLLNAQGKVIKESVKYYFAKEIAKLGLNTNRKSS